MLQNIRQKIQKAFALKPKRKQNLSLHDMPLYLQRDAGLVQKDINNSYDKGVKKQRMQKPVIWM